MKRVPKVLYGLFAILHLVGSTVGSGQSPDFGTEKLWTNKQFLRSFLGAYQPRNRIEPYISEEDRSVLEKLPLLLNAGKKTEAIKLLEQDKRTATSAPLLFNLGSLNFEADNLDEAADNFSDAIELAPDFLRAHQRLGYTQMRMENVDAAIGHLQKAVALGDGDSYTFGLLGRGYAEKKHWATAAHAYQMAQIADPKTPAWIAGEARCRAEMGDPDQAAALSRELTRHRPSQPETWQRYGHYLLTAGNSGRAAAALDIARRSGPLSGSLLTALVRSYIDQNMPSAALGILRESIIRENTGSAPIIEALENVIGLLPDSVLGDLTDNLQDLSTSDAELGKRLKRLQILVAFRTQTDKNPVPLQEQLKERPLDGEILLLLARDAALKEDLDKAILFCQQASGDPDHQLAAIYLEADLRIKQGDYASAAELVRRGLKLRPDPAMFRLLDELETGNRLVN